MRRLIALLLLISLVCTMVSCEGVPSPTVPPIGESTADTTVEQKPSTPEPLVISEKSKTDYVVVYSDILGTASEDALNYLQNQFKKTTGASISCIRDTGESYEYEILFGSTSRTESQSVEPPLEDEILIKVIGKKILLLAGCEALMNNAIDRFIDNLGGKNGVITLPDTFELRVKADFARIRIATFNIHNGLDVDYNFKTIARDILQSGASVVALQEIDQMTSRNQYQDTMQLLSEYTGFPYYSYFATVPNMQGGQYGIAVLSKYPINSFEGEWLPRNGNAEQRAALKTVINIGGASLSFISTHCDGGIIEKELATIRQMLSAGELYAIGGDFNSQDYQQFEVFEYAGLANSKSNPLVTTRNGKYIDNLVCSGDILINSAKAINTGHSDHFLVVADVTIYLK